MQSLKLTRKTLLLTVHKLSLPYRTQTFDDLLVVKVYFNCCEVEGHPSALTSDQGPHL